MPHQFVGLTRHRRHPAEGGLPHNLDPKHPEHVSDAPAVSWVVSESDPAYQVSAGTTGSMMGSESGPYNPGQQPSVGERNVVIPSPSCDAAHRESQPSPA
ncbi:hypothetical protein A2U01_0067029, partial [Trifolium medium]|nr:hypothetical protein [Trifolium medium]